MKIGVFISPLKHNTILVLDISNICSIVVDRAMKKYYTFLNDNGEKIIEVVATELDEAIEFANMKHGSDITIDRFTDFYTESYE